MTTILFIEFAAVLVLITLILLTYLPQEPSTHDEEKAWRELQRLAAEQHRRRIERTKQAWLCRPNPEQVAIALRIARSVQHHRVEVLAA